MTFTTMFLAILVGNRSHRALGPQPAVMASRVGAPLLLVFLAIGLLAGEDGPGGIQFSDAPVAYSLGGPALAIIFFDSGFNTRLKSFRNAAAVFFLLRVGGITSATGSARPWRSSPARIKHPKQQRCCATEQALVLPIS